MTAPHVMWGCAGDMATSGYRTEELTLTRGELQLALRPRPEGIPVLPRKAIPRQWRSARQMCYSYWIQNFLSAGDAWTVGRSS